MIELDEACESKFSYYNLPLRISCWKYCHRFFLSLYLLPHPEVSPSSPRSLTFPPIPQNWYKKTTLGKAYKQHFPFSVNILAASATAKLRQSCPTLCDPIDGSLPGSPIPGILQARTLEWVVDGHEFGWTLGVGDGQGSLECRDSWGCKESDTTEWLNWIELALKI